LVKSVAAHLESGRPNSEMSEGRSHVVPAFVAALWSYVVLDFVIHAVVLAFWWRATESFWLPPLELAKRIPFAYTAFAVHCLVLCLILWRVPGEISRVSRGLILGALLGLAWGIASALGVYSIVRAPLSFLLVGPASTTICSATAGTAAAWVQGGARRWRRVGLLVAVGFVVFVLGIVLQNVLGA
jgi:hypothetical protein